MFQEAAATALDVKTAVPGARYYLLCEWLDMTPINTGATAIDEIIILRKAKRLPSNIRAHFNTAAGRQRNRATFIRTLRISFTCRRDIRKIFGSHSEDDWR